MVVLALRFLLSFGADNGQLLCELQNTACIDLNGLRLGVYVR